VACNGALVDVAVPLLATDADVDDGGAVVDATVVEVIAVTVEDTGEEDATEEEDTTEEEDAAEEEAVVLAGADVEVVEAGAEEELAGAEVEAEAAARTEEQSACTALRTERAPVAPQEESTQLVAALWIAASFVDEHWHKRSVSLQVEAEVTALAIQVVAQAGMAAWAKPERARTAKAG